MTAEASCGIGRETAKALAQSRAGKIFTSPQEVPVHTGLTRA
ncbi:hypothetical protein [Dysosmobacter sp.]